MTAWRHRRSIPGVGLRPIGPRRRALAVAALAFLAAFTAFVPGADAQSTESTPDAATGAPGSFLDRYFWGKNVFSVGFFYIDTLDSAEPLTTTTASFGLGTFTSPDTSSSVSNAVTPSFTFRHFFTDHVAATFAFGVPPKFTVHGSGTVIAPLPGITPLKLVDLGASENNPVITAREWGPALLLHYFFNEESSRFRPFVGIGVSYNFFSDVKLNGNVEQTLRNLGPLLQLGLGNASTSPADVSVDLTSSWQVVGNAGVQYEFVKNWIATGSIAFVPLKTTAVITLKDNQGNKLAVNKADIKINPLVFELAIGYKF